MVCAYCFAEQTEELRCGHWLCGRCMELLVKPPLQRCPVCFKYVLTEEQVAESLERGQIESYRVVLQKKIEGEFQKIEMECLKVAKAVFLNEETQIVVEKLVKKSIEGLIELKEKLVEKIRRQKQRAQEDLESAREFLREGQKVVQEAIEALDRREEGVAEKISDALTIQKQSILESSKYYKITGRKSNYHQSFVKLGEIVLEYAK